MSEKQTGGGRRFLQVGLDEVMTLYLASLARELELALKLDRPGLSDEGLPDGREMAASRALEDSREG